MAYVYICDACRAGHHEQCEESRDVPMDPDPEVVGGGICVCSHDPAHARGVFEASVWADPPRRPT